jgi:hypothetical protein
MGGDSVFLAVTPHNAPVEARLCAKRVEILQKLNAKGRHARSAKTAYVTCKGMFKPEIMTHD